MLIERRVNTFTRSHDASTQGTKKEKHAGKSAVAVTGEYPQGGTSEDAQGELLHKKCSGERWFLWSRLLSSFLLSPTLASTSTLCVPDNRHKLLSWRSWNRILLHICIYSCRYSFLYVKTWMAVPHSDPCLIIPLNFRSQAITPSKLVRKRSLTL